MSNEPTIPGWNEVSCTLWEGAVGSHGYGNLKKDGRYWLAHRLAYEDQHGPIPEGLVVDHLCLVKTCIEPSHLEAVTVAENNHRFRSAKTACVHGHPYTTASTYFTRQGWRSCRPCGAERARKYRARI